MNKRLAVRAAVSLGLIIAFGAYSLAQTDSDDEKADKPFAAQEVTQEVKAPTTPLSATARASAEAHATKLLELFAANVSGTPQAEPTTFDTAVIGAVASADYAKELSDAETAGKAVHKARRYGFVPMAKVGWLGSETSDDGGILRGVVTLVDGRHRSVEVVLDAQGRVASFDRPVAENIGAREIIESALMAARDGKEVQVWNAASDKMKGLRSADEFKAELVRDRLTEVDARNGKLAIEWGTSSQLEGGFRINGEATLEDGTALPFYGALLDSPDGLRLMDIQSTSGFIGRIEHGTADTLDITLAVVAAAILLGFLYILFFYGKGLQGSPIELYYLFFTKVTEYAAYGAAQLAFMFYLREDIGLSDVGAGSYISAWSTFLTLLTMVVGAVCDAIGIKKTLLIGAFALMLSRAVMPFSDGIWVATIFGFIPLAFGVGITGPVLSVGIKRFTTIEGAALGFGLFYTLMNVGWALGAWIFDKVRINMGEMGSTEFLGAELSTYQVIIGIGFFINLPDLLVILLMRDGVEMTETGVTVQAKKVRDAGLSMLASAKQTVVQATKDTFRIFGENFVQRAFWMFIIMIGITVFARLTFFHFHYTWPSYGSRYFGQGSLVGNVFGVLNPVMIVFLVPVIAYLTRKVSSYWMLLIGTAISVSSIFFVVVPVDTFAWMETTWLGTVIYDRWLEVPVGFRDPYYLSMVLFVMVFTVGEAIWSPRLMQFTAEVAPPGREGSYVALAYLPYFGAKFIAGPMAGLLLKYYSPEFGIDGDYMNYPDHQMIWWWIGGSAALTPFGLVLLKRLYRDAEERAREIAAAAAAEQLATAGGAPLEAASSEEATLEEAPVAGAPLEADTLDDEAGDDDQVQAAITAQDEDAEPEAPAADDPATEDQDDEKPPTDDQG